METPTLHFVCGPACSGKTTYAAALAGRAKAVRLSIAEWVGRLFEADRPGPCSAQWTGERAARCETQMWALAEELIARGVSVVFDLDHALQEQRDAFRARAMQTRAIVKMHYLDVDRETRRARFAGREAEAGAAAFEALDRAFEAPTDDELYGAMIVCDG